MQNVMDALHGCPTVTFDSCNKLLPSVYTILVNHTMKKLLLLQ